MCGPLTGMYKGVVNSAVLRDRGYANNFIKFKYPNYASDDEALRKTGNLQLTVEYIVDDNITEARGKIDYTEVLFKMRIKIKAIKARYSYLFNLIYR